MRHAIATRVAAGAAAAGIMAGLVAVAPAAAFADSSTTTTANSTVNSTANSNAGSTGGGATTPTTQASNPLCTPATFSQAQQRVEAALSARVTRLNALLSAVDNTAIKLTNADRQTLQNDISTVELPGIEALQPQAQQATTCPQLRGVARAMVFNFRVYVVMTPQVHLTIVADTESAIETTVVGLEPTIQAAIQNARAHGKNVSGAEAAFADLQSKVSAAQGSTNGVAAQVLAQTPQGYPVNWPVFLTARTNLTNARTDLHAAYADAQQIKKDLS